MNGQGSVTHEEATVLGIAVVTSNATEANPAKGKIAGLWTRFDQEDLLSKISGKKTPVVPLGVYTNYESDHTGQYQLMAGAVVDAAAPTPEGMLRTTIPAGSYLLFEAEGRHAEGCSRDMENGVELLFRALRPCARLRDGFRDAFWPESYCNLHLSQVRRLPNTQMEPTRPTVFCKSWYEARGSFATVRRIMRLFR